MDRNKYQNNDFSKVSHNSHLNDSLAPHLRAPTHTISAPGRGVDVYAKCGVNEVSRRLVICWPSRVSVDESTR